MGRPASEVQQSLGGSVRGSLANGEEGGDSINSRSLSGKAPEIPLSGEPVPLPGDTVSLVVQSNRETSHSLWTTRQKTK